MSNHGQKQINWGGLTKDLLAGAAIVVGVSLVFPGLAPALVTSLKSIGMEIGSALVSSAPTQVSALGSFLGGVLQKAGGIALAWAGINYFSSEKRNNDPQVSAVEAQSFAMREDIRKMQGLMMARQQAAGFNPAQMGR